MGVGPILMFDKSLLQSLSADEIRELDRHFILVTNPVLEMEILADLKHPKQSVIDKQTVQVLASKMTGGHVTPIGFRKAALGNLYGFEVPMTGQVPIDITQPNVSITPDGDGMLIDSTVAQKLWDRWAVGNFDIEEHEFAARWRVNIAAINLPQIEQGWKDFAQEYLMTAKSLEDVSVIIHKEIVNNFSHRQQGRFLWLIFQLLEVKPDELMLPVQLFNANLIPRVKDFAPYASFLGAMCLLFLGGLGRGLLGRRPTNFIDLQYAFYAPFSMLFASSDKFHRQIWPLAGQSKFIWGPYLKDDLANRVLWRKNNLNSTASFSSQDSVIDLAKKEQMRP